MCSITKTIKFLGYECKYTNIPLSKIKHCNFFCNKKENQHANLLAQGFEPSLRRSFDCVLSIERDVILNFLATVQWFNIHRQNNRIDQSIDKLAVAFQLVRCSTALSFDYHIRIRSVHTFCASWDECAVYFRICMNWLPIGKSIIDFKRSLKWRKGKFRQLWTIKSDA